MASMMLGDMPLPTCMVMECVHVFYWDFLVEVSLLSIPFYPYKFACFLSYVYLFSSANIKHLLCTELLLQRNTAKFPQGSRVLMLMEVFGRQAFYLTPDFYQENFIYLMKLKEALNKCWAEKEENSCWPSAHTSSRRRELAVWCNDGACGR